MKKIKSIKNKTSNIIIINNISINQNQIININDYNYGTNFKSIKGFNDIMINYINDNLDIYDYKNNIINNDEFIAFYNYFQNKFLSLNNYFKIYEFITDDCINLYNNYSLTPKSIDYIKDVDIRFARKETFTNGFLTNVEYYESSTTGADNITYFTNPILNVNMKYFINNIGYVAYRETTRKWVKNDGTYSNDTKISTKNYNGLLSREEAITRRNNIINQLVIDIVNIVYMEYYLTNTFDEVELMVLPLMDSLENELNKYIKGNLQPLIVGIIGASSVTYPWLDIEVSAGTTLQEYIENKLLEAILSQGVYTSTEPS
jgi:hypothetical protein